MTTDFCLSDKKKSSFECIPNKNSFYFYAEKDVQEAVRRLIEWLNNDRTLGTQVNDKYEHYIHKAHLRTKIRKLFGEKLTNHSPLSTGNDEDVSKAFISDSDSKSSICKPETLGDNNKGERLTNQTEEK